MGRDEKGKEPSMIRVHVFHNPLGDCTNWGISSQNDSIVLVNEEFRDVPHYPYPHEPQGRLAKNGCGNYIIIPNDGKPSGHYMMGGNFAYTSDSRLSDVVGIYGAIPIHDRAE
jgi:hypothetical protein